MENKTKTRETIVLLIVSTSIFFEALDIAIVNLAIPLIQKTFGLTGDKVQWIQTLYVLFYGGFLIIGGKLADRVGRKTIFMTGSALFLGTSLGAGITDSFTVLLLLRSIQGLGAALVIPSAFSIITNMFTDAVERNRAIGIFGSFAAIGSGSGLAVGGLIATYLGWQWIFFINVPVIGIALLLGYFYIPADQKTPSQNAPDLLSGFLLTLIIIMLSYITHELSNFASHFLLMTIMMVTIVFLSWIFIRRSHRQEPLIDFSLFNHPSVFLSNGNMFLLGSFFTGYLFCISIVLQTRMHYTSAEAGFLLFPFSILSGIVSKSLMPRLMKKFTLLQGAILGMSLMTLGGITLTLSACLGYNFILLLISVACVTGTGIAVCFMALNVMAVHAVPVQHHGVASSLATTAFFFGGGLGLSLIGLAMQLKFLNSEIAPLVILIVYAGAGAMWLTVRYRKEGVTKA